MGNGAEQVLMSERLPLSHLFMDHALGLKWLSTGSRRPLGGRQRRETHLAQALCDLALCDEDGDGVWRGGGGGRGCGCARACVCVSLVCVCVCVSLRE